MAKGKFISKDRRHKIYVRDNFRCYMCNKEVVAGKRRDAKKNNKPLATLDHLIPRCKGGAHDETNLMTCCEPCNQQKNNNKLGAKRLKKLQDIIACRKRQIEAAEEAEREILGFLWKDIIKFNDKKMRRQFFADLDTFLGLS